MTRTATLTSAAPNAHVREVPTARESELKAALRQGQPVICAVDDDDLSAAVVAAAATLAAGLGVPLTVVHSPHPDVYLTGEPHRVAIEHGHRFLDGLTDGYRVDERIVEVDEPGRLITELARDRAAMVVVGTRQRTGLRAAIMGSVSQAVIAGASCPVVTVSSAPDGETSDSAA